MSKTPALFWMPCYNDNQVACSRIFRAQPKSPSWTTVRIRLRRICIARASFLVAFRSQESRAGEAPQEDEETCIINLYQARMAATRAVGYRAPSWWRIAAAIAGTKMTPDRSRWALRKLVRPKRILHPVRLAAARTDPARISIVMGLT